MDSGIEVLNKVLNSGTSISSNSRNSGKVSINLWNRTNNYELIHWLQSRGNYIGSIINSYKCQETSD